ncbi:MAG: hypothetical protein EPN79_15970 [Burkholderiaceae bacterium]|nr:MAG: hypothetical protein EPN79_15970 [Burkholderiaceae bacterium]
MNRKTAVILSLGAISLVLSSVVSAQTIGDIADNVSGSTNKLGVALQVIGRLVGLGLIFMGLFTHYKAHKEQGQGRSSHSMGIVSLFVGAAFFYAASLVHTTGNTIWGNGGGDSTTINISNT